MRKPKVTIITASYNHELYLAYAIESVLAQSFQDWEHLIWDDGSSDGSVTLAQSFAKKDSRIRVFTHPDQKNLGQENTRNAALKEARGELVCLLDSDDWYEPGKLGALVPCFNDSSIGLAYGRAEFFSNKRGRFSSGLHHQPSGFVFEDLLHENFLCAGATLFRISCLKEGFGFDSRFKTIGEYPLWLKIASEWKLQFVDQVVSVWRAHDKNLGKQLQLKGKEELVFLFKDMLQDSFYLRKKNKIEQALVFKKYDWAAELLKTDLAYRKQVIDLEFEILRNAQTTSKLRLKALAILAIAAMPGPISKTLTLAKNQIWKWRSGRSI